MQSMSTCVCINQFDCCYNYLFNLFNKFYYSSNCLHFKFMTICLIFLHSFLFPALTQTINHSLNIQNLNYPSFNKFLYSQKDSELFSPVYSLRLSPTSEISEHPLVQISLLLWAPLIQKVFRRHINNWQLMNTYLLSSWKSMLPLMGVGLCNVL